MHQKIECSDVRDNHINRIKGLLFAQGIRGINIKSQYKTLAVDKLVTGDGHRLPCGRRERSRRARACRRARANQEVARNSSEAWHDQRDGHS
jgi:hypothetical protein